MKHNDPTTPFSIIRRLQGGSKRVDNMSVYDKSSKLPVNSRDILKRWGEYFQETLNVVSSIDQDLLDRIHMSTLAAGEKHRQNAQLSMQEIRVAANQMKLRKAPGRDDVTVDILKAGGEPVIQWLLKFFTDVWENEETTKEWKIMTLIKIYI